MAAATGGSGGAIPVDALARAHAALLKDHTLQFAFQTVVPPKPPSWLRPLLEFLKWIAPAMKWVFWGGVALALGMILFFIARELIAVRWPRRRARARAAPPAAEWRPAPEKARALLEDADSLAAQGRFAEAAHLLLHRSIEDIEGRRPRAVRPSLTARDIARLDSLPAAARAPFQLMAAVVERSFFGGREVDAGAFAECRRAYETFAFPEAWA
jgi:hypothetical protein